MNDLIARHILAAALGVQTQTIAKWEREGWFPKPEQRLSDRLILYRREQVLAALQERTEKQTRRPAVR